MKFYIETDRLILRDFLYEDADDFFEMDSDVEVHKFLGNKPILSLEETIKMIDYVRQQYDENNIGRWTVIDKVTKEYLGWAGLKFITTPINGYLDIYDIGYRLNKKHWGKGIASEASKAALDYGFNTMHLEEIHGAAHVENMASQAILKKLGMVYRNQFIFQEDIPCCWYSIKK
jgi:[ribosomal protein S5]-alanine N-acetyltransferase